MDKLVAICARHTLPDGDDVVVPEAYLPYMPPDWNGLLVLAEAQNLSTSNVDYVRELMSLDPRSRMTRLRSAYPVGVAPWDDGSLKLAIEAALDADASRTAVSNAVLWSRRVPSGANANPSTEMVAWSSSLWRELVPLLRPVHIVTAGKVARTVLDMVDLDESIRLTNLRLPSPQAMSRVSGMFRMEDLLARYPEVRRVVERESAWGSALNRVFFACHAVSIIRPTTTI